MSEEMVSQPSDSPQGLARLLRAYRDYYDVEQNVRVGGFLFDATAVFHSRSEQYVLVKKAKIWGLETNEYVYFLDTQILSPEILSQAVERAREDGLARIHPHSEHMYSHITVVFLAQEILPQAEEMLAKLRFQKSYRLSFHGWTELRVAAFEASGKRTVSNRAGRKVRQTIEDNLLPRQKKKGAKI